LKKGRFINQQRLLTEAIGLVKASTSGGRSTIARRAFETVNQP